MDRCLDGEVVPGCCSLVVPWDLGRRCLGPAIVALGKVGKVFLHLRILDLGLYMDAAHVRKRFSDVHVVLNLRRARREELGT